MWTVVQQNVTETSQIIYLYLSTQAANEKTNQKKQRV